MRMRSYQDYCRGAVSMDVAGSTDLARSGDEEIIEDTPEYYIYDADEIIPEEWVLMGIASQEGPVPSGDVLRQRAEENGYNIVYPCSGVSSVIFDQELWCPSLYRVNVLFNSRGMGHTARQINKNLFGDLIDVDTGYAVFALFASSEALRGDTQNMIEGQYGGQLTGEALTDLGKKTSDAVVGIGDKVADFITPGKQTFWDKHGGKVIIGGIFLVGGGIAFVKWGLPAWRKYQKRRKKG